MTRGETVGRGVAGKGRGGGDPREWYGTTVLYVECEGTGLCFSHGLPTVGCCLWNRWLLSVENHLSVVVCPNSFVPHTTPRPCWDNWDRHAQAAAAAAAGATLPGVVSAGAAALAVTPREQQ